MKKIFLFLLYAASFLCCVHAVSVDAGDAIAVKVSIEAEKNSFALVQALKNQAKKAAIEICLQNRNAPKSAIQMAKKEYALFVDDEDVETISRDWSESDGGSGHLTGEFKVKVKKIELNKWLKEQGVETGRKIIVLEELPSGSQVLSADALEGKKSIFKGYNDFKRQFHDRVIKNVEKLGYDVKDLDKDFFYEDYKNKNAPIGVMFYNVARNDFEYDDTIEKAIRDNETDAFLLFYRFDKLDFDESSRKFDLTISFSVKNLEKGTRRPVGTQRFTMQTGKSSNNGESEDWTAIADLAARLLLKEDMAESLDALIFPRENRVKSTDSN